MKKNTWFSLEFGKPVRKAEKKSSATKQNTSTIR